MKSDVRQLRWYPERIEKTLKEFPREVEQEILFALSIAQKGDLAPGAKPMKGFGTAKVFEIVVDEDGNAYRGVYAVIRQIIWVLHVFQKKSHQGSKTPQREIKVIRERLKRAQREAEEL